MERLAPPAETAERQESGAVAWWAPPPLEGDAPRFPTAWVLPSNAPVDEVSRAFRLQQPIDIGGRLQLTGNPDMRRLGEAVHGFLAADRTTRSTEQRFAMAKDVLERWGVGGALKEASMLEASDRLRCFIAERWPRVRWRREIPIFGCIDKQNVSGRIRSPHRDRRGLRAFRPQDFSWRSRHLGCEGAVVCPTDRSVPTHNCGRGLETASGELHPHAGSRDDNWNRAELNFLPRHLRNGRTNDIYSFRDYLRVDL